MKAIRFSLPGYDALSDTNPDHFALYADQDNVLIKEKARGSVSISSFGSSTIAHGLGYIPFCLVFVESISGEYRKVFGSNIDGSGFYFYVSGSNLIIVNNTGSTKVFKYYIFYDLVD